MVRWRHYITFEYKFRLFLTVYVVLLRTSLLCEGGARGSWSECGEEEEERELFSRTIIHASQDSDSAHSEEESVKTDGQRNCCHGSTTEPIILPTSPRHQIHSVIMHLQEGHR